jgi:hypothetical protein
MSLLTSCFNGVSLQNEVSVLSPRVAFLDQQRTILTVGNSHLKQRIAALAQDKIFKDGQCSIDRKFRIHTIPLARRSKDSGNTTLEK